LYRTSKELNPPDDVIVIKMKAIIDTDVNVSGSVIACYFELKDWLNGIALHRKPISELRNVSCHMGSHSCHLTQVKMLRRNPSYTGRCSICLPCRDKRLSWPQWWL